MNFANPTYLWALLGMLVPIAIHLWSRKDTQTIRVGSISMLEASDTLRARSVSPSEWALLLLRLLLIALLAILLAGPQVSIDKERQAIVYVAEASLLKEGLLDTFLDSLDQEAEIRILDKGLPLWDADVQTSMDLFGQEQASTGIHGASPKTVSPNYWQLVPDLHALEADSVLVFTRAYAKGLRSKRPEMASHIRWVVAERETKQTNPIWAYGTTEKAWLFELQSGAERSAIRRSRLDASTRAYGVSQGGDSLLFEDSDNEGSVPFQLTQPLYVHLVADDSLQTERFYLEAALSAASRYLDEPIEVSNVDRLSLPPDLTIWLSGEPVPNLPGKVLVFQPDSLSGSLIAKGPQEAQYHLTQRLNAGSSVAGRLTEQLIHLLRPIPAGRDRLLKADLRQVEASFLAMGDVGSGETSDAAETGSKAPKGTPGASTREQAPVNAALWLVLFLLLVTERLLALKRKQ